MSFTSDASGKSYVLGHESDTIRVDGAQISIFEEVRHEGLGCLLDGQDRLALEADFLVA